MRGKWTGGGIDVCQLLFQWSDAIAELLKTPLEVFMVTLEVSKSGHMNQQPRKVVDRRLNRLSIQRGQSHVN
ncbi:hypothetical protein PR003_g19184 [Phytophthora rubi]|uniref:Uncharacterized protein n=1 Tax=Phytophthora rubi TaxID=129364 RepID=A0A6A4EA71_9STRA|nr:hypothetical protein PR001_g21521 [Phytophthora rubi]KAE9314673.1 hypothetical protein PR003_g19184 [Phytophthora rubi]